MPAVFGDHSLPSLDRPFQRLAVIGVLVAALGLAACGRKGPLDLPPGASVDNQPAPQTSGMVNPMTSPLGGGGGGQSSSTLAEGPDGRPMAPKGPKKRIPLDVLLN